MKGEQKSKKNNRRAWTIDESKCLSEIEVEKLQKVSNRHKVQGLKNKRFTSVRNWFMVELGLHTGLRVAEMASLKHGNALIDGTKSSIVVLGKGNKKRAVWISSEFKRKCQLYISYKINFGYAVNDDSFILNNNKGDKITKRALQKFFKILVKESGISAHYYIHCLRHTYTTFLLKASNNNYRFVQQQLGHASIRTTQVYAGIIESEGKRAVENLYK